LWTQNGSGAAEAPEHTDHLPSDRDLIDRHGASVQIDDVAFEVRASAQR